MAADISVKNACWLEAVLSSDRSDSLCDGCGFPIDMGLGNIGHHNAMLCKSCLRAGLSMLEDAESRRFGPRHVKEI